MSEGDAGGAGGKAAWTREVVEPALARHPERAERFRTTSGVEVERLYAPGDAAIDHDRDLGYPGEHPFTRGIQREPNIDTITAGTSGSEIAPNVHA